MDISEIFDMIAGAIGDRTAFVQIQIGNEYQSRHFGGAVPNRPTVMEEPSGKWCTWMGKAIDAALVSDGTKENHRNCLRHLRTFNEDMTFEDLSPALVASFESHLSGLNLKQNTVTKLMKIFRRYVNVAIEEDRLAADPFRKWHARSEPTSKQALSERNLRKWEQHMDEGTDEEVLVARAFLFSCYTGLRYSDIREVHYSDIKTVGKQKWLAKRMHKTKKVARIPLSMIFGGKARDLVTTRGLLFPGLPANSRCNTILRRLTRRMHIRKHISFHCGRVTCATILIHRGVPITTIQQILGHSYIGTTQGYAHVLDNTIWKEVKRAFR